MTSDDTTITYPDVMTVEEVADYLQVGVRTIYQLAADGQIPAAKVAGKYRFLKDDVDQWLRALGRQKYQGPSLADVATSMTGD